MPEPVLSVRNLVTQFNLPEGKLRAVDGVSFDLYPGEVLGIVGESGSGKSTTALSILRLIPQPPGRIAEGEIRLDGRDLLQSNDDELRAIRGQDISMIFQDPMTSLNPVFTVGNQIAEVILAHDPDATKESARERVIALLKNVGVPNAEERMAQYPHQYSGGMRQRAMIAMAIANNPKVLVADEPTTALDVTIQAQVLEVLKEVQRNFNTAIVLITHDLSLTAEIADRIMVMYAGRVVESAPIDRIFHQPSHPYTLGLMNCLPPLDSDVDSLEPIPGSPPDLLTESPGCPFQPRCTLSRGRARCREEMPPLSRVDDEHLSACHFYQELSTRAPEMAPPPSL